ncbi:MAG: hypothetical protein WKG01_12455 [Kofleriaceae bacterium]
MNRKLVLFVVVAIAAFTQPALAQRSPDTATMDRGDGLTRLGLDLGLALLESPPYDLALRIEPYGQFVSHSGLGFYGALPIAKSFGDGEAPDPEPTLTIGNLELGGLYVTSGDTLSWVLRGGLALPTAGDSVDAVPTNILASVPRLTDLALAEPDALYVRLAVSPLIHHDKLFLRADLGFDLGIDTGDFNDADNYFRFNVGGGVDLGVVALGLELINLLRFDEVDDNEQTFHTLAFTIRFMGERLQPVLAIGTPLDDAPRDQVKLFITFGIQFLP